MAEGKQRPEKPVGERVVDNQPAEELSAEELDRVVGGGQVIEGKLGTPGTGKRENDLLPRDRFGLEQPPELRNRKS